MLQLIFVFLKKDFFALHLSSLILSSWKLLPPARRYEWGSGLEARANLVAGIWYRQMMRTTIKGEKKNATEGLKQKMIKGWNEGRQEGRRSGKFRSDTDFWWSFSLCSYCTSLLPIYFSVPLPLKRRVTFALWVKKLLSINLIYVSLQCKLSV